jgi:hypothetical protein
MNEKVQATPQENKGGLTSKSSPYTLLSSELLNSSQPPATKTIPLNNVNKLRFIPTFGENGCSGQSAQHSF